MGAANERDSNWAFLTGALVGLVVGIAATYVILAAAFSGKPVPTLITGLVVGLLSVLTLTQALRKLTTPGKFLTGTLAGFIGGPMLFAGYLLLTWLLAFLNQRM